MRGKLATQSAGLLPCELSDPGFNYLLDKCNRERLVHGEVDGAFGGGEGFQVVLEGFDHGGGGEEAEVIGKGGVPDQDAFAESESGDTVADRFGRSTRHDGANRGAHFAYERARGLWDTRDVFVDSFRRAAAFWRETAFVEFGFFHAEAP